MADKEEMEITITPEGDVQVHIKGVKGKRCLKYVEVLQKAIGDVKDQKFTSEYYEPEPKVGLKISKK